LPYERRQRVQIVTVRSASEIFLHTAATKRDALAKHAELQDVYLKEEAPPIVWTTHVGELYVSNVKGAYCRVKLLRRTNDAVVVELIDTGAVRDLPVNSEFRVLLPTLRYKPTCIGPCRLAGE
uniref:Tudor domain-containing protein n=1 Tax=Plectus sambesii TaxID=2011161 RepID=A0A914VG60_9BILA